MVIFHGSVSLPEGNFPTLPRNPFFYAANAQDFLFEATSQFYHHGISIFRSRSHFPPLYLIWGVGSSQKNRDPTHLGSP